MKEKNSNLDTERIATLEEENKELRKQLGALETKDEDVLSYRIFVSARKKFLTWIGVVVVVITAFGVVSVTNIVQTIKERIESRGVEGIVEEIKKDFEQKHQEDIVNEIINRMIPAIEAKVDEVVRTELLSSASMVQQKEPTQENIQFARALETSYEKERYFVVAGSSPRPLDLERELQRVKEMIARHHDFDLEFPDVHIYPPSKGNLNYALVIATNLTFSEAKELTTKAIDMGFRGDTFPVRASRAFFDFEAEEK